jgi:hypothetical protein
VAKARVKEAEAQLGSLGCAKKNLQIRADNENCADFYRAVGYDIEERISIRMALRFLDCQGIGAGSER